MLNTKKEKAQFIRDLIRCVQRDLIADLKRVPEEWDGHELRQWIADRFRYQVSGTMNKGQRRRKDYENEIAVRNL